MDVENHVRMRGNLYFMLPSGFNNDVHITLM